MKKFFKLTAVSVMTLTTLIACSCGKEKQKTEKYYPKEITYEGKTPIPDHHPEFIPPAKNDNEKKVIFLKIYFPCEYCEWLMEIRRPHKKHDDQNEQPSQTQNKNEDKNTSASQSQEN